MMDRKGLWVFVLSSMVMMVSLIVGLVYEGLKKVKDYLDALIFEAHN